MDVWFLYLLAIGTIFIALSCLAWLGVSYWRRSLDSYAMAKILNELTESAYLLIDASGLILESNSYMETLTGYEEHELVGASIKMLLPDIDAYHTFIHALFSQVQRHHMLKMEEAVFVLKSGAAIPVSIVGAEYTRHTTMQRQILLYVSDVRTFHRRSAEIARKSEEILRKNIELEDARKVMLKMVEELKESKEKIEKEKARDEVLLESIGDGMIVTDEERRILMMNHAALELLKLQHADVFQRHLSEIVTIVNEQDDPLRREDKPIYKAFTTLERVRVTAADGLYYKQGDRVKFPVALTASPVIIEGKAVGVIEVFRNVEKEREIDRMKTEFISLASHQLRTPLSAIRWFTEMLLNGDAGELQTEQKDFLHNIEESTNRMIQLVNSLLNISRIESGRIVIDSQPTDLSELVHGVVNDLKAKIEERQHHLVISVHDGLPKISIDPRLIRQVYMNLLTNAIKYTPAGGEIQVFISRKGDEIISQVSDNGYGIPANQQDRMFEKFFRAENVVKIETDGTGLGMYLIKAVIESSRGRIWFESQENKGTTFWFSLPVAGIPAKKGEVTLDV